MLYFALYYLHTDITNLCRTMAGANYTLPIKAESYYTAHRDE
jgi:hypothetical protein